MTAFRYRALTEAGVVVNGLFEASNESLLLQHVREQGLYLVSARRGEEHAVLGAFRRSLGWKRRRVPVRTLAVMSQELATLLQAGLELDRALAILSTLRDLGPLRESISAVRLRVQEGSSLADAVAERNAFPGYWASLIRAAEAAGTLEATFRRLSEYLTRSAASLETLKSALVYPAILLVTATLSITIILTLVLPAFEPLFTEAGRELPLPTRVVMTIADGLRSFWWLILIAVAILSSWLRSELKKPLMRSRVDARLLRIPMLGDLLALMDMERFARTLGTLLANGVALPLALSYVKGVVWNSVIAGNIEDASIGVREGERLAECLARSAVFPPLLIDLVRVGEETGKLAEMLLRQADLDEQRMRQTTDRLLALLTPALTIVLGLIVGLLIWSVLVAILSVNSLVAP